MWLISLIVRLTPKNPIFSAIFISILVFFIPLFLVLLLFGIDFKFNILFTSSITSCIVLAVMLNDIFGKKKHESILYSMTFSQLSSDFGFQIEEHNDYRGYIGSYQGFIFRIFYNYNTNLRSKSAFRDYTVMLYFRPDMHVDDKDELKIKFNLENLNILNQKYSSFNTQNFNIKVNSSTIVINKRFSVFTTYEDIKNQIIKLLNIAQDENLVPINKNEIEMLDNKRIPGNSPEIDLFWDKN